MSSRMLDTPLDKVYQTLREAGRKHCPRDLQGAVESAPMPMLLQLIALAGCNVTIVIEEPAPNPGFLVAKETKPWIRS